MKSEGLIESIRHRLLNLSRERGDRFLGRRGVLLPGAQGGRNQGGKAQAAADLGGFP
jgi:hypothetical protein